MRIINVYVYLISVATVLSSKSSLKVSRRITGTRNKATEYPKYVVAINYWNPKTSTYQHRCMGTLLSKTWVVSAGHCFRSYRADELGIAHGDIFYPDVIQYRMKQFHKHDDADLAVAESDPINVSPDHLLKLSFTECPAEVRAVYHSWGGTRYDQAGDPVFSRDLLYSSTDVIVWVCDYPDSKICFEHVDGTGTAKGDSGSGFIVGHGPGPMFDSVNYDIRIIGVLSRTFTKAKFEDGKEWKQTFILAERISHHLPWINKYVKGE